ncbi:MFS transporter [candidate division TA06 bacterium]|nr:MFS transporter [candidate division TA06 bacterium]
MTNNARAYDVLKIADFRKFMAGRFFVIVSIQMVSVIVGWQVYELTRDPLALGMIGLAEALAFISVALFGGHYADSHDRQRTMAVTSALLTLCAGALLWLSWCCGVLLTRTTLPIYGVIALMGLIRAYLAPSTMALSAQIVPRELYARMSAYNSLVFQIGAVGGPAMAGLIYGFFGVRAAYATALAMGITGSAAVALIKSHGVPRRNLEEPVMTSLASGVKFVFGNPIVLPAMSLDMFAVLFGGATAMLPMVADTILHVGPKGLGFLRAAPAAGAAVMALALAHRPPLHNAGKKLLWVVAGFGACMMIFALSRNFWLSMAALALSGAVDNISVVIRQTIVQLYTPDEMRGRVSAVNSVFIGSSNEIGSFESGVAAKLMGLVPSLVFNSGMTFVIAGAVAWAAPKLRRLDLSQHMEQKK